MLIAAHRNAVARRRTTSRITAINTLEPGQAAANKNIGIVQRYRPTCRSCTIIILPAEKTGIAKRLIFFYDSTASTIACYFVDICSVSCRHPSCVYQCHSQQRMRNCVFQSTLVFHPYIHLHFFICFYRSTTIKSAFCLLFLSFRFIIFEIKVNIYSYK